MRWCRPFPRNTDSLSIKGIAPDFLKPPMIFSLVIACLKACVKQSTLSERAEYTMNLQLAQHVQFS